MIYIIRNPILWLGISAYGGGVFVSLFFERRCSPDYFFFSLAFFFYFISNDNCRLLTINIVSFIFFLLLRIQAAILFTLRKSSPVNIVYRKINWQNPAFISAYTQSEYRISNYLPYYYNNPNVYKMKGMLSICHVQLLTNVCKFVMQRIFKTIVIDVIYIYILI
jgi:hypothetical protein